MRPVLVPALVLGLVGVALCGGAAAQTVWNLSNDFSTTANPNGDWSYGSRATLGGAFQLHTLPFADCGCAGWESGGFLGILRNPSFQAQTCGTVVFTAVGVTMHPGFNGEYSVARWTAPSAGTFDVVAVFQGAETVPTTSDAAILQNGTVVVAAPVNGFGPPGAIFGGPFTLNQGDTLDFAVGFGANGTFDGDSTFVGVSISTGTAAAAVSTGMSCGGSSLAASPVSLGGVSFVSLSGGVPGAASILVMNDPLASPLLVAPGCELYLDVFTSYFFATQTVDANGGWLVIAPVPIEPALVGYDLMLQAFAAPGTGPQGFDLTNGMRITIGP
jgi:hypothetical protein